MLAAALAGEGPALAPVGPDLPRARLERLLQVLAPSAVVTPDGVTPHPGGRPAGEGAALVVVTSGSTGEPKAAELTGAALLASARASLDRIAARPGERWLCCLPAGHIAGLQVLVRSLVTGTTPQICAPSDTAAIAAAAQAPGGCAHASLVPTQLRRLLAAGAGLSGLRTILLGGAAPPAGLLAAARAAGARVVTTYGMTETCGGCVYDGVPLDGVDAAPRADGRIRIAGPVLFSGYRLRPGLTAAAFDGTWFVTSDLGRLGPGGRLVVRGRADDVITTGGEKVVPAEVAAMVEEHPAVREAVVFGVPDREWGERVTAVAVAADPARPPVLAELRGHLRGLLPAFAVPRDLVVAADIPLLPSGKPDIAALRAWVREQSGGRSVST
ncbi:MAG TPA: AMP-binding protein [Streptosporangiaceae bacterium]|nr:AMP-binding protein [Streptosporangiaceae bacterium]